MKKIKVILEAEGLNFFWSQRNFKYPDGTSMTCCWEDIDYQVIIDGKDYGERCTTIDAKSFVRYEVDHLLGDFGRKMEIDFPGYIEEELNGMAFGIPFKDLLNSNEVVMGYSYDDQDDLDKYENKYEIDLINLPINEFGLKPNYIFGFVPDENLSKCSVESFMRVFLKKHYGAEDGDEIEFEWINDPPLDKLEKEWEDHLQHVKEWEEMKARGEKMEIVFAPMFLSQIVGEEVINEYEKRGLMHGKPLGDGFSSDILLIFEDGHTEILQRKNEIDDDHFKEPSIE